MAGLRNTWNIEFFESATIVAPGERERREEHGQQEKMPFQGPTPEPN